MPGPLIRDLRKYRSIRSRRPRMEGPAAEAARGSSSPSQAAPSPPQHRSSMDIELEERCPICLDSRTDPSLVMPCLHGFCYACIQRWASNKIQCPLCKGTMTSILHAVRADDDFEEDYIIPPETPPEGDSEGGAPRDPDAPNLHRPEERQQWETEGDHQHFMGGFHLPNWMSYFSASSVIQQTLHSWFYHSLEMLFETVTSRAQRTRVPEQQEQQQQEQQQQHQQQQQQQQQQHQQHRQHQQYQQHRQQQQQRCREQRHRLQQRDARGTTGQEDSSSSLTPAPARSRADEMPSTSSSAMGWGPSTRPSTSTTTRVEQETQAERERLRPGPPNFVRRGYPLPRGPQQPHKRRASSPTGFPAHRRPRY